MVSVMLSGCMSQRIPPTPIQTATQTPTATASAPFNSATFVYDGDGKRVKSTINPSTGSGQSGVTTTFVGAHYEVTNGVVTKYYYAGSQRIAMRTNGTLSFLLGDHLGSTASPRMRVVRLFRNGATRPGVKHAMLLEVRPPNISTRVNSVTSRILDCISITLAGTILILTTSPNLTVLYQTRQTRKTGTVTRTRSIIPFVTTIQVGILLASLATDV